ncbi:MAG: NADH-quinone oxidoreductase subunit A [Anaerolineae bacterium]|nr:NADH-quinone oxidoreductase subunit A [Anaerolineae bacterium]
MVQDFEFIGVFGAIVVIIPFATLFLAWLLRPKKPHPAKQETYESGMQTIGQTWVQFKAQYYIYAIIFVIFDVEAIFLFPFAVAYRQLNLYALVWVVVFILLLLDGLFYAWRKGAMRWL